MRYHIRKGPIECYHVADAADKHVSVISVINHNLSPEQMAFYLRQAAAWFDQVSRKEVDPVAGKIFDESRKIPEARAVKR